MHVSSSLSVSRVLNGGGVQSERIYREKGKKAEAGDRYAPSDRCTGTYGIWTCDIRSGDAGVFSDKTGKFIRAVRSEHRETDICIDDGAERGSGS